MCTYPRTMEPPIAHSPRDSTEEDVFDYQAGPKKAEQERDSNGRRVATVFLFVKIGSTQFYRGRALIFEPYLHLGPVRVRSLPVGILVVLILDHDFLLLHHHPHNSHRPSCDPKQLDKRQQYHHQKDGTVLAEGRGGAFGNSRRKRDALSGIIRGSACMRWNE